MAQRNDPLLKTQIEVESHIVAGFLIQAK